MYLLEKKKVNYSKEHCGFLKCWINCFPRPNHQLMRACPSNLTTLGPALPQINIVEQQLILETFLRRNSQKFVSRKSQTVDYLHETYGR
jgi:hypothetical protein